MLSAIALTKRITDWLMRKLRMQSRDTELSLGEMMNIEYDRQLTEVMRRHLRPESICIDGGAHKGQMLLEMCGLAPKAIHHAFEPIPELAKQLQVRFPGTQIHQHAIADYSGSSSFKYVQNAPAYSVLKERTYDHVNPQIEEISVEVVRLDDVITDSEAS